MDKEKNCHISSRHKRRLAQEETEKDYLLLESLNSGATYFGPSVESIKECRIENENDQLSVSTSPSLCNDQEHSNQYSPDFSGNNDRQELLSNEICNSSEVVTDDEDFVDTEEQKEIQSLSIDSDNSSDDADDMNVEYIDDEDGSMDNKLLHDLRNWSFEFKIKHNAINALIKILKHVPHSQFKTLPTDARALLKTPKKTSEIVALSGGSYYHFGLSNTLEVFLLHYKSLSLKISEINLLINIDGLPLSRSSPNSFWPILLSDDILNQVYIIGLFYGEKKPKNSNEFLQQFVKELIPLVQKGYHSDLFNCDIKINVKAIICDAPAKSFILNIKGHNGYSSCTKCTIYGDYVNSKMCFPYEKRSSALRTDEDFVHQIDSDYHQGEPTILLSVPSLGLVSNIALDYMHLICLGVVKKLILLWMNGPLAVRINTQAKENISQALCNFRSAVPKEFSRRSRSLNEVAYWKATEFRQFLLYTGPIALKRVLNRDVYTHFLTLHVAVSILISPTLIVNKNNVDYAEKLLQHFVESFEKIYGKEYMSHNIHNLLHLSNEVRTFDSFSSFRFENFLQILKSFLRKSEKPLQQVIRRYTERRQNRYESMNNKLLHSFYKFELKARHATGLLADEIQDIVESQYRKLILLGNYEIDCKSEANNCIMTKGGNLLSVKNIVKCTDDTIYIVGYQLRKTDSLYLRPFPSENLDIYAAEEINSNVISCPLDEVQGKMWKIKFNSKLYVIPIRHVCGQ